MSVSIKGAAAIAVSVTTVVHMFDTNTHNTHLYDENEILLLLFSAVFWYKNSVIQTIRILFVFGQIVSLTIHIWPNT